VFSAVSGSSVATAATIGTIAVPNMLRLGYDRRLLFGSLAAGGTLGILIPPSLALIIYSALTEVSLGKLFVGAMLPGIMMAGLFHIYIVVRALVGPSVQSNPEAKQQRITVAERLRSLIDMVPLLALVVGIIVSMYQGWATPTEIAGVAAAMAIVIAVLSGSFSFRAFWEALIRTVLLTSMLMFAVIGAQIFAFAVFSSGLNFVITDWIASLTIGRYEILAMIILIYIILGMFIDATSMMVLTLALVFPVIAKLQFDPVWFGILLVLLLELGLITPPVGFNLFTIKAISPNTIALSEVTLGSLPFCFIFGLGTLMLILFPQIVLWLPSKMFG
jgi:tripartite ATP-independent transporter DctM subunit